MVAARSARCKGNLRALDVNLLAALGGRMANPAERGRKKSGACRKDDANLFLFFSFSTRRAPQSRGSIKLGSDAAEGTRGAGRDAASTPDGEGRRERGVRWREKPATRGQSDKKKPRGSGRISCSFISSLDERKALRRRHWRRRARRRRALLQKLRFRNSVKMMLTMQK